MENEGSEVEAAVVPSVIVAGLPEQSASTVVMDEVNIPFISIKFQSGPMRVVGYNGAQIEDVIDVLVNRLKIFQAGSFPCRENELAIEHLLGAKGVLNERTARRIEQGVEGTHEKHV